MLTWKIENDIIFIYENSQIVSTFNNMDEVKESPYILNDDGTVTIKEL